MKAMIRFPVGREAIVGLRFYDPESGNIITDEITLTPTEFWDLILTLLHVASGGLVKNA